MLFLILYKFNINHASLYLLYITYFSARLAKIYLGIPASQASCERLFSISKNDVTECRTSMLPELVESLLFVRKRRDIAELLKNS